MDLRRERSAEDIAPGELHLADPFLGHRFRRPLGHGEAADAGRLSVGGDREERLAFGEVERDEGVSGVRIASGGHRKERAGRGVERRALDPRRADRAFDSLKPAARHRADQDALPVIGQLADRADLQHHVVGLEREIALGLEGDHPPHVVEFVEVGVEALKEDGARRHRDGGRGAGAETAVADQRRERVAQRLAALLGGRARRQRLFRGALDAPRAARAQKLHAAKARGADLDPYETPAHQQEVIL